MRWSTRFGKEVYVTRHARERMAQRGIIETELADLLENGEARYKDPERLWIAKAFPERNDNLICAALQNPLKPSHGFWRTAVTRFV